MWFDSWPAKAAFRESGAAAEAEAEENPQQAEGADEPADGDANDMEEESWKLAELFPERLKESPLFKGCVKFSVDSGCNTPTVVCEEVKLDFANYHSVDFSVEVYNANMCPDDESEANWTYTHFVHHKGLADCLDPSMPTSMQSMLQTLLFGDLV